MRAGLRSRQPRRPRARGLLFVTLAALLVPSWAAAQSGAPETWNPREILAAERYVRPQEPIADAVLAPWYLNVSLTEPSADREWFVTEIGDGPVPMSRFSKPFDELGGMFLDYEANRDRALTIRSDVGLRFVSAEDGRTVDVRLPVDSRVSDPVWSPVGHQLAFYVHTPEATYIYVSDPTSGRARRVTTTPVLATAVTSFQWTSGGSEIATVLVPERRDPRPLPATIPQGPRVKQTQKGDNILRTYRSLMKTPYDKRLLEWHVTGQLAVVEVGSRRAYPVGKPSMIWGFDFSPDGKYARVTLIRKPFSYLVPVSNFGKAEEIWDRSGKVLATVDTTPMNTGLGTDRPTAPGVGGNEQARGKRQVAWRKDAKGLTFLEREPAPDTANGAADQESADQGGRGRRKDRVMLWAPPFDSASLSVVYENPGPIQSHRYSPDYRWLILTERQGQDTHLSAVDLSEPSAKHTLARYRTDDVYANPGSLLLTGGGLPPIGRRFFFRRGRDGGETVQLSADGSSAFFYGVAYDRDPMANGPRSFLDRVALATGDKTRVWEGSNQDVWEHLTAVLDIDSSRFVVEREGATTVGQSYLLSGDSLGMQLTRNKDYLPDITHAKRERFVVERPDGFRFLVNVTLPPDYAGGRLPAMFWFYPREYQSQKTYDEAGRTYNKNAFPRFNPRFMEYLVRLGYAVVEPDAPIVGKAGEMNDNYAYDLRNNLSTVIDSLDDRGIIDRARLGIGGHSYGAFSTANAMVHTPFFKAGIAGDGNYNRTLTPLAFQNEHRFFWDARDVYLSMSPFMYANQLTGALLMYHGLHDQNVGTDPTHTPRMFHALNGLGKTAAMYLYPYEDHGPAAKETLLDLWARWTAWLDVYLRGEGTS